MCFIDFENSRLAGKEAKEMDMVNYLSTLGHEPVKNWNHDILYLSPLREEKPPSLEIDRKLNKWHDHSIGEGGNPTDFSIRYHDCTIVKLLKQFNNGFSFRKPAFQYTSINNKTEIKIDKYLNQHRIPPGTAKQYCRELHYKMNSKTYNAVGFESDSGGRGIHKQGFMGFLSFKFLHKNLPENSQDFVVLNSIYFFERTHPFMETHSLIRLYLDRDV